MSYRTCNSIRFFFWSLTVAMPAVSFSQFTDTSVVINPSEQSEVSIAFDPLNPSLMMAGWNDWRVELYRTWCAFSTNGGLDWIERGVRNTMAVDPSVGFGTNGKAYYCYIDRGSGFGGSTTVSRTNDLGASWDHKDVWTGNNDDKPFMAIDNRQGGTENIYITWTVIDETSYRIKSAVSKNGGQDFQCIGDLDEVEIGKGSRLIYSDNLPTDFENLSYPIVQSSMPVVSPNGDVYVVWDYLQDSQTGFFKLKRLIESGCVSLQLPSTPSFVPAAKALYGIEITSIPSIAIDPVLGHLHIVYCESVGEDVHIKYIRSVTGGASWSQPQLIADLGVGWQFFPWVSVEKTGRITIAFMHCPNPVPAASAIVDAYVCESYDRGEHFANAVRVSSQSTFPSFSTSTRRHHYLGSASQPGGNTNIVWTDYRNSNPDIYFSQANTITHLASQGKTTSINATASNSQRKLVRESTGKLHVVFESGGEIFYRSSTNDGTTWQTTNRISAGTGDNSYPSITERSNYIYAVSQRQNGTNWDLLYSYSTNGGTTWLASPIILVSNFSCSAPGPQPVILAGTPSTSFELMVVYRHSSGLSSLRSTNYPVGGNWTGPVSVTGTNLYSQNASLTYRSNGYPPFRLVWDQNNAINYSLYYPDSWTTPYDIGNGAYMASNKTNPSISVTSSNDIDIVWEGTYSGTRSIITNRNLSSVYYAFQNYSNHYYKPSVTGHVNGRATVTWHDNSLNVRKAIYDPSYGWYYIGSIIGASGVNASTSIMNQQGGDAKVVWTEGTSSPYTIHLDGAVLNKPIAKEGGESNTLTLFDGRMYRQLILRDSVTNAFLAVQLEAPRLVTASSEEAVEFIAVDDTMRYTPQQIFSFLETKPFPLTSQVNAFSMRRMIRAQGIGTLASQGRLRIELVNAQNGQVISSFAHFDLVENGHDITLDDSVRVPVNRTSGQYRLRLKAENLALTPPTRRASVVSIFVGQSEGQSIRKLGNAIPPATFLLNNYPNPFNPTTTIQFQNPTDGFVSLMVFNTLGQEVATLVNEMREAGYHRVMFNASQLASGVYMCKLQSGNFTEIKRMLLLK